MPLIASSRAGLGVARRNWALDLRTASGRWCRQSNQVLCSACPCADPPHRARATFPPPNPIKCRFAFAPAPFAKRHEAHDGVVHAGTLPPGPGSTASHSPAKQGDGRWRFIGAATPLHLI